MTGGAGKTTDTGAGPPGQPTQSWRISLALQLDQGDIDTGRGTRIVYDSESSGDKPVFKRFVRASQGGATFGPTDLDEDQTEALLEALREEQESPPPGLDPNALDAVLYLLSKTARGDRV